MGRALRVVPVLLVVAAAPSLLPIGQVDAGEFIKTLAAGAKAPQLRSLRDLACRPRDADTPASFFVEESGWRRGSQPPGCRALPGYGDASSRCCRCQSTWTHARAPSLRRHERMSILLNIRPVGAVARQQIRCTLVLRRAPLRVPLRLGVERGVSLGELWIGSSGSPNPAHPLIRGESWDDDRRRRVDRSRTQWR